MLLSTITWSLLGIVFVKRFGLSFVVFWFFVVGLIDNCDLWLVWWFTGVCVCFIDLAIVCCFVCYWLRFLYRFAGIWVWFGDCLLLGFDLAWFTDCLVVWFDRLKDCWFIDGCYWFISELVGLVCRFGWFCWFAVQCRLFILTWLVWVGLFGIFFVGLLVLLLLGDFGYWLTSVSDFLELVCVYVVCVVWVICFVLALVFWFRWVWFWLFAIQGLRGLFGFLWFWICRVCCICLLNV